MEPNIILSILICSLEDRKEKLNRLLKTLNDQKQKNVEILTNIDKGELSVGRKRNSLLSGAQGEYVSFVDDDDIVSPDYIETTLRALQSKPDCAMMWGLINWRGETKKQFIHSIQFAGWYEGSDGIFYRSPNHLNAVKKNIALKVPFVEIDAGEDLDYSKRIRPYIKTEGEIDHPIYYYEPGTWK